MAILTKKRLSELVGGDIYSSGGDKNTSTSEIETGPIEKTHDDNSYYEKGRATTTDKVVDRYRQDIPWFAVYSYATPTRGMKVSENKNVITKNTVEEKIEDLVKKSKTTDVMSKDYNPKIEKLIDAINDGEVSNKQLEKLEALIKQKKENKTKQF
jgi:hypothetical protein